MNDLFLSLILAREQKKAKQNKRLLKETLQSLVVTYRATL